MSRQRLRLLHQLLQRQFPLRQQALHLPPHERDLFLPPLLRGDRGAVELRQRGAESDDGAARVLRGGVPGGASQLEVGERGEAREDAAERREGVDGGGCDVERGDAGEGDGDGGESERVRLETQRGEAGKRVQRGQRGPVGEVVACQIERAKRDG